MTLDEVRKQYNDGLLLESEAVQHIESLGETKTFAQKFLRGFTAENSRLSAGASRTNLLLLPR